MREDVSSKAWTWLRDLDGADDMGLKTVELKQIKNKEKIPLKSRFLSARLLPGRYDDMANNVLNHASATLVPTPVASC